MPNNPRHCPQHCVPEYLGTILFGSLTRGPAASPTGAPAHWLRWKNRGKQWWIGWLNVSGCELWETRIGIQKCGMQRDIHAIETRFLCGRIWSDDCYFPFTGEIVADFLYKFIGELLIFVLFTFGWLQMIRNSGILEPGKFGVSETWTPPVQTSLSESFWLPFFCKRVFVDHFLCFSTFGKIPGSLWTCHFL